MANESERPRPQIARHFLKGVSEERRGLDSFPMIAISTLSNESLLSNVYEKGEKLYFHNRQSALPLYGIN